MLGRRRKMIAGREREHGLISGRKKGREKRRSLSERAPSSLSLSFSLSQAKFYRKVPFERKREKRENFRHYRERKVFSPSVASERASDAIFAQALFLSDPDLRAQLGSAAFLRAKGRRTRYSTATKMACFNRSLL